MGYDSVLNSIQKGAISPVYLFFGEERYQKRELIKAIKERLDLTDKNCLNLDTLHAGEISPSSVIEKAETFPFLSEKRVVIVHDVDSNPEFETSAALLKYLSGPAKFTSLVFTANNVDKRKKFFRLVHEKFTTVSVAPLKRAQVKGWLLRHLSENNTGMTEDAINALIDLTGTDLDRLQVEIEKLSLYGEGEKITRTDVFSLVSDSAGESVFEIADAMGRRDPDTAIYTLNKILHAGEPPLKIFGLIVRQLRIILLTWALQKKNVPARSIPLQAGFPPFLLGKYTKMSALFDYDSLKGMFLKLSEADQHLKSDFSQKVVLEKLIIDFCTLRKKR